MPAKPGLLSVAIMINITIKRLILKETLSAKVGTRVSYIMNIINKQVLQKSLTQRLGV